MAKSFKTFSAKFMFQVVGIEVNILDTTQASWIKDQHS